MSRSKFNFIDYLKTKAQTEEDVKYAYVKEFGIEFSTRFHNDCRTDNVLMEFKFDKQLRTPLALATILAQALYYVRRTKYGQVVDSVPASVIIADVNQATVLPTTEWASFYDSAKYDWTLAPSSPDQRLVDALLKSAAFRRIHIYELWTPAEYEVFARVMRTALTLVGCADKKYVTAFNFEDVFEHWKTIVGKHITDEKNLAVYYIKDLEDSTNYDAERSQLIFQFGDSRRGMKFNVPAKDYQYFWSLYRRPPSAEDMESITSKADRLNAMDKRRFHGEFYTPLVFAQRGVEYLTEVLGADWWLTHRIWDMACGTGNLEYHLPLYTHVYMSTIDADEVEHLRENKLFPGATIFQYDYLNDDVELLMSGADLLDDRLPWKMPRNLREDLANPENKWVVLINPPYGEATDGINSGSKKKRVSADTAVATILKSEGMGKAGNELFVQFLYRLGREIPNRCTLGMYSTLKYVSAPAAEAFRTKVFRMKYKSGFMFPSWTFEGTKGAWPVAFAVWQSAKEVFGNGRVVLDVLDERADKIEQKTVTALSADKYLNQWIERPKDTEVCPPLGGAVTQYKSAVSLDRTAKDAIGYVYAAGNDMQHTSQNTALVSSAYGNAHGWSITPDNFEKSIVSFAVRRVIPATWTNNRDQFKQPTRALPASFVTDGLVWSLFNGSNQTSSLKDVQYKGNTYQIRNQFYPWLVSEVRPMVVDSAMRAELKTAEDTFVARYLIDKRQSAEALAVLDAGMAVYRVFYSYYSAFNQRKFKLSRWDSGWYQVRMALADAGLAGDELLALKTAEDALRAKLVPKVYEYGFLDREIVY